MKMRNRLNIKLLVVAFSFMVGFSGGIFAQTAREGFMLDDSRYGYKFNPAMSDFKDFIGLVRASENVVTNVGAGAFLYPSPNGKVVTALHSSIPAETFLGKLSANNYVFANLEVGLFSYGFNRGNAFHTIEYNIRGKAMASVPKTIFEMAKKGTSGSPYDFSPIQAQAFIFSELAYGYTRKITNWLTLGGRLKFLDGHIGANLDVSRFDMTMNQDVYTANYSGSLDLTTKLVSFLPDDEKTKDDDEEQQDKERYFSGGVAADLGVVIKPIPDLTLSLSVLDLGGIWWKFKNAGSTEGTQEFTGLTVEYSQLNGQDIVKAVNDKLDEFYNSMEFKRADNRKVFNALPFQANFGVKYVLPFYRKMTVGVLGLVSRQDPMRYWDARLGVTERFNDWLEVTANVGHDTFGMVYGLAGAIRVERFHISVGLRDNRARILPDTFVPIKPSGHSASIGLTYDI